MHPILKNNFRVRVQLNLFMMSLTLNNLKTLIRLRYLMKLSGPLWKGILTIRSKVNLFLR